MADYGTWPEKLVAVTTLQLDPKNPRIPAGDKLGQRELIAELVEHDDIYELAKDISRDGYSPLENLIALEEDGKPYVLEGNRRLAALKLLISPDLAPEKHARKFRVLAGEIAEPLKKVRVVFAPSREAAAKLIMQKHTRPTVARWSTLQQARYYKSLVREGVPLKRVAEEYGGTAGEIADALRMNALYEMACGLELDEDVREAVHNPREFPATSLTRLFSAPKVRDALGIEYTDEGGVVGTIHPDEFRKVYKRVLTDLARGRIDSRVLDTVENMADYIEGLGPDRPRATRKGRFEPEDIIGSGTGGAERKAPPASPVGKVARTPRRSKSVVPTGTKCTVADERIRDVFDELRKMAVDTLPNSSAVMLRILLDLTVGHYMEKTGKDKPIIEAARAKEEKKGRHLRRDWSPGLRDMLTALLNDADMELHPQAHRQVQRLLERKATALSLDDLNGFVHSAYADPTAKELRAAWKMLDGIFSIVLHEPSEQQK